MTPAEFVERLRDGDRWIEVIEGSFVQLEPPDDLHGNVVRNIMNPVARWVAAQNELVSAFDLAIQLRGEPLEIAAPAVSFFRESNRFAFCDELLTDRVPELVIEILSSPDRRQIHAMRQGRWEQLGVREVWLIDTATRLIRQIPRVGVTRERRPGDILQGEPLLPDLNIPVEQIFADPDWWNPPVKG